MLMPFHFTRSWCVLPYYIIICLFIKFWTVLVKGKNLHLNWFPVVLQHVDSETGEQGHFSITNIQV